MDFAIGGNTLRFTSVAVINAGSGFLPAALRKRDCVTDIEVLFSVFFGDRVFDQCDLPNQSLHMERFGAVSKDLCHKISSRLTL